MGWLIGTIVVIAIIYFMIVSPGFRSVAILIVVAAGIGIWVLYENTQKENERRSQEQAARERFALTSINVRDLSFSDVQLAKSPRWTLKGNVVNNSKYDLGSLTFLVKMEDCPPQKPCITIGQESARISVSVPPGQMRAFSSSSLRFEGMPAAVNLGWSYEITQVRASGF
jgi:hypothetical protein